VRSLNQPLLSLLEPSIQQKRQEPSGASEIQLLVKVRAKTMKVSARNVLGYGQKIVTGAVNTEVTLEIAPELKY